MVGWIVLGVFALIALWAVAIFNKLVKNRNLVLEGWSGIDVQLKRRYDLIPNLVETVKGYAGHEREVLARVVELRNSAASAQTATEKAPIENMLTQTLRQLFALAEAYPDLKANQNVLQVQEELTSTENKVAFARQGYNDAVMTYNTKRESFPDNIVAGLFAFKEAMLLEATESKEERQAPKVKF